MRNLVEEMYSNLIYTHDCVVGLTEAPYKDYPLNPHGLLHAADNVLIYSGVDYHLKAAEKCREIAINKINNR